VLWFLPPFLGIFGAFFVVLANLLDGEGASRPAIAHARGLGASLLLMAGVLVAVIPSGLLGGGDLGEGCSQLNGWPENLEARPQQLPPPCCPARGIGKDETGTADGQHRTSALEAQARKLLDRLGREISRPSRESPAHP
jgi:hypothetical protein